MNAHMRKRTFKIISITILLAVLIALGSVFIWFKNCYAPKQFERYVSYYSQGLDICPAVNFPTTKVVLKMGFYQDLHLAKSDPSKAYLVANAYQFGIGTKRNKDEARDWMARAIAAQDPRALLNQAVLLYVQGDKQYYPLIANAALNGNIFAASVLADKNPNINTVQTLAAKGYGTAQYTMAELLASPYNNWEPRPFDPRMQQSFKLMLAAAKNPNTPTAYREQAMMGLIIDYQNWQGTAKDMQAASYWTNQLDKIDQNGCDPYAE